METAVGPRSRRENSHPGSLRKVAANFSCEVILTDV